MFARRSVLALITAVTVGTGLATTSPSFAAGQIAPSPSTTGLNALTGTGSNHTGPTPLTATGSSHTGPYLKPTRDRTAPEPVTDLSMTDNDAHSISLSWVNPSDPDFAGVLIRRAAGDTPPITAADGILVANLTSRQTTFVDKHLTAASTYSYAVFPRDKSRNVGIAATLTTATRSAGATTGLRGKLTDQQGRPISLARVEVREASTGNGVAGTATSSTGQFSVTGLMPGVYLLCFFPDSETTGRSATGYLPGCYRQQPYGYGNTGTPVTVIAGKMTSGLVDYLPIAGALSGRVTDSAGRGISDVSVGVVPEDPNQFGHGAITRADGSYTVTGLAAGSYSVCFNSQAASGASTSGYLDECYDDQPPYSSGTPVTVSLGQTSAGVNATLAIAGAVTGHVTDPNGAPVQDISALVFGAGSGYGYSDSNGGYTITGLPTGSYTLCFDGSYTVSDAAPYGYTNSCAGDHWLTVYVVAGQVTTANGTVEKAGAVGGTVTGNDGPVAGVWVSVFDSSGSQLNSISTDDNGGYLISGVASGEVTVCFDPTYTAGGYQRTCYGAQPDGSGSPITVTVGQLSTADVQLQLGASITGTITDVAGAPVSGVLVSAYGMSSYDGYYAQTDESGSYTLGGLTADDYQICFDPSYAQSPPAGGYAAQCYDNQPSINTADPVTVGGASSVTVDAVLRAGAAITGQLTGSDGATLGGVYVYAYAAESGQYITVISDYLDGSYRLAGLSEGDYLLCFSAFDVHQPAVTGYVDECYDNQRTSYTATPVHVTAGAVRAGIDAELAVGAGISGQVTDSAGNGIPNAYVEPSSADGSYFNSIAVTDDSGHYQLTGLPATAVLLCFQAGEQDAGTGHVSECYDDQPDIGTATPVNTVAGEIRTGIDAELAIGSAITGRVTDSAGNGIPNVYVNVSRADGSYLPGYAFTDDTGRYRINSLPVGALAVCFQTYEGGANGTGYMYECYDNQPDVSTATPVNTTAGEVRAGIDAELADAPAT